ncbi:alpha-2,8-sialyltransferase 8F-like isoform X2 [Boleophthalmus pectinirostris]|uniref:alpha-2,8-sialyltransferase 8F-like isoform X2 n=1 Tax=Boleophthalmus pectinirostris TaxID=150288 RepID=UPI00242C599C|nr:alpha-2,8-sialyltransferase 8F-like isoform X2 [Boleophthalmus pectinirostris]
MGVTEGMEPHNEQICFSKIEPRRPSSQKNSDTDNCGGCSEIIAKVVKNYSLAWKKQEDNFIKFSKIEPRRPSSQKNSDTDNCGGCSEIIAKVVKNYSPTWKKQEDNFIKFRSQLSSRCNGFHKSIVTQTNTPLGTKLVCDGQKNKSIHVNQDLFNTFLKGNPFSNKSLDTCAVVGNGGILANSSCGEAIDSTQFVIRCNLPPLENDHRKHVGNKTDIVTANPSIFTEKYGGLMGRRRPFVNSLNVYGKAMLLIPAFSFIHNTPLSMRAFYSIEDFGSPIRPIFFHPEYLQKLAVFWRSQGLRAIRLSTGLIMASLALEVCNNVHLYGFWPFSNHPYGLAPLTNHYYDDRQTKKKFHAMPAEFELLLKLHHEGVLKVHLGQCPPQKLP